MKKLLLSTLCAILLSGCAMCANSKLDILTLFSTKSCCANKAWVGTFQLVWNDMKNNIIKHDVKFVGEKPTKELIGLNSEEFNSKMLNESSYYTSWGKTAPAEKIKIKEAVAKKFNEKSEILDSLDWSEGIGKYYAYAMLKKEFEFPEEFDKLEKAKFNNKGEFEFFGIKDSSKEILDENVKVLFYNNKNDYAIQLLTTNNDIVYLYRTNSNAPFNKLYEKMIAKTGKYEGEREFNLIDTLKVPNLKINDKRNYPTLTNKKIEGTEIYFSQALETIQLELNNKGGKVKSEAILMTKNCVIAPMTKEPTPRHFNFDKTFAMFLVDAGKENPYLALRVKDLNEFQK
ncbi:MAG: hypothetical protein IJB79_07370 [Candidatus Gastranaerophilales bacterium]|nr:hypothetical protein [Candidatus Gastranaerophilales bacterium]